MTEPDPDAQERLATLQGARGQAAQFQAIMNRTREIIEQRFQLPTIIAGQGVFMNGSQEAFIFARS